VDELLCSSTNVSMMMPGNSKFTTTADQQHHLVKHYDQFPNVIIFFFFLFTKIVSAFVNKNNKLTPKDRPVISHRYQCSFIIWMTSKNSNLIIVSGIRSARSFVIKTGRKIYTRRLEIRVEKLHSTNIRMHSAFNN